MSWHCLLCNSNGYEKITLHVRDSYDHGIVKCFECGHVQLYPVPSEDELAEYYRNEMQRKSVHGHMTREQKRLHVKADTDRRVALALAYLPDSRTVLDIGCGEGFFVEAMEQYANAEAEGREADCDTPPLRKEYDAITAFHVMEHVSSPVVLLKDWFRLSTNGGYLIIEVPNHDDWMMRCPEYAAWHYQRAHIHYFTPRSLLQIVNTSGIEYRNLKLFGVQRYSYQDAFDWREKGKPDMTKPIGYSTDPLEHIYKNLRESTLTSDTLCLILQK